MPQKRDIADNQREAEQKKTGAGSGEKLFSGLGKIQHKQPDRIRVLVGKMPVIIGKRKAQKEPGKYHDAAGKNRFVGVFQGTSQFQEACQHNNKYPCHKKQHKKQDEFAPRETSGLPGKRGLKPPDLDQISRQKLSMRILHRHSVLSRLFGQHGDTDHGQAFLHRHNIADFIGFYGNLFFFPVNHDIRILQAFNSLSQRQVQNKTSVA